MTTSLDRDVHHRFMEHGAHLDRGDRYSPVLTIQISTGVGGASTPLAAFDAALCEIGVGNLNVLQLSSVIPPGNHDAPRRSGDHTHMGKLLVKLLEFLSHGTRLGICLAISAGILV